MSDNPKIRRRLRCPNCGSIDAIKWGVRNGSSDINAGIVKLYFLHDAKRYPNQIGSSGSRNGSQESLRSSTQGIPNLFEFIKHPGLPKTTNALESFFGHIKDQLRLHRGLSETRVDNFIKWYLYFNDEKKAKKQRQK